MRLHIVAVADPAFHDIPAAIFGVLLASMAFACGVGTMSFTFAFEKALDVVLCVKESTTAEGATSAFSSSFALPLTAEALLEEATESPDWFATEASPGSPGHSMLVEHGFRGFGISHGRGVRSILCRNGFLAVIGGSGCGRSGIFPVIVLVTVLADWKVGVLLCLQKGAA